MGLMITRTPKAMKDALGSEATLLACGGGWVRLVEQPKEMSLGDLKDGEEIRGFRKIRDFLMVFGA